MHKRTTAVPSLQYIYYMYITHEYFTHTESDAKINKIYCTHAGHDHSKK